MIEEISVQPSLESLIKETFGDKPWVKVFLSDSHHGLKHGDQVRAAACKLLNKLNQAEKAILNQEMQKISTEDPLDCARLIISIAGVFHDCGRFNEQGEALASEQGNHHIVSATRARIFNLKQNLENYNPAVEEAILCHDFQSKRLTPELKPPVSMVGKIVQSADQLGWFHPDSINRTLAFNKSFGRPFFNPEVSMQERINWTPDIVARDALTVLLNQIFGPTGQDRFGIECARKKVKKYEQELKAGVLNIAKDSGVEEQVKVLIKQFGESLNNK